MAHYDSLIGNGMDIRSGQKLAWENKVAKGFNTTDVPLEFCLLAIAFCGGLLRLLLGNAPLILGRCTVLFRLCCRPLCSSVSLLFRFLLLSLAL